MDVAEAAKCRIAEIWTVYKMNVAPMDVSYIVGVVIDHHWPATQFTGSLSELYRQSLAPEQTNGSVITAETLGPEVAEKLWQPAPTSLTPPNDAPKLLRKGMPNPCSIRYISTQFLKDLKEPCDPLAKLVIDCAILGAYPHATTIAPNNVRKKVYAGKVNYSAVVNACSSRDLFNIVAEFVIAITMLHPALSHAVSYNPDWKDYKTAAVTEVPRTKLFKLALGDRNVVQPRRSRVSGAGEAARNDVSSASGFPAIVKALAVKPKLQPKVVADQRLRNAYRVGLHRGTPEFCKPVMLEIGLTEEEFANFSTTFLTPGRLPKRASGAIACLSAASKAVLSLYCHAVIQRAKTAIIPRSAVRRGCEVLVCTGCYSLRSGCKGAGRQGSNGVDVDTHTGVATCLDCGSRVIFVSLASVLLRFPGKVSPEIVTQCAGCGAPTVVAKTVGIGQYCSKCVVPRQATVCVCGNPGTIPFRVATGTKTVFYALCDRHARMGTPKEALSPALAFKLCK